MVYGASVLPAGWRALVLIGVVVMAGCSSTEPREQPVPVPEAEGDYQLKLNWSQSFAGGQRGQHLFLTPAVRDNKVYAATRSGLVGAYDARNGRDLWWTRVDASLIGGVGADSEQLYVVTRDGILQALSREGELLWQAQLPNESLVPPQSNGRQVIVQTIDGQLIAFSQGGGEREWLYDSNMPLLSFRGNATPWVNSSSVVAGFDNGRVVSLDVANGRVQWQQALGTSAGRTELEQVVDVDASPVVRAGVVYATGFKGKLAALRQSSGEEIWSRSVSSLRAPAVDDGRIVVAAADGAMIGYDLESRREMWRHEKLLWRRLSAPVALKGHVLVGDFEGYLYAIDPENGTIDGLTHVDDDGLRSEMVRFRDQIILFSNGGLLASYGIEERESNSWFLSLL